MFTIDKQTLSDLNAIDHRDFSLCNFFDNTSTLGGRSLLYSYFINPLKDIKEIQDRNEAIEYLSNVMDNHPFDKYMFQDLEKYLSIGVETDSANLFRYYSEKLSFNFWSAENQMERVLIKRSIAEIAMLITYLTELLNKAVEQEKPVRRLREMLKSLNKLTSDFDLSELKVIASKKISPALILKYDYKFRNLNNHNIKKIFTIIYELDIYQGIAKSMMQNHLIFPTFHNKTDVDHMLEIKGAYNLFLKKPIKNDIIISQEKNIWFLTGANMTGKSTLLKTLGACIYLAHLGLPVPAEKMDTLFFDGLLTTINLGDDLSSGRSHFYNEVLRVKKAAELLASKKRMIILLDELFKGTNYDDAYHATLTLVERCEELNNSIFLISSHITELSTKLNKNHVELKHLETLINEESHITFTYRLIPGISTEKLGMRLLEREKVFELFKSIPSQRS
ncbi:MULTISPECIES: MutS-related protein [unclassified Sphingobacterium]|uniref:MutS-related protein n=1 Tax=unclassified Sphingobacterium TaxID=2609468 RepID=UPI001048F382|nr:MULTISPECIES: DNA mismatch repair protein MutS [unclassified Sphingobacterium]MCS3554920.1 DNA mismatch repair ATPase MutS [Sphingobacterium sp. JUb21]TCR05683.1 MutS-like protein [Sphingobacterium sp. JUb20]